MQIRLFFPSHFVKIKSPLAWKQTPYVKSTRKQRFKVETQYDLNSNSQQALADKYKVVNKYLKFWWVLFHLSRFTFHFSIPNHCLSIKVLNITLLKKIMFFPLQWVYHLWRSCGERERIPRTVLTLKSCLCENTLPWSIMALSTPDQEPRHRQKYRSIKQKALAQLLSQCTYLLIYQGREEQLFPSSLALFNRNFLLAIIYIFLLQLWLLLKIMTLKHNTDILLNHWGRTTLHSSVCPCIMNLTVLKIPPELVTSKMHECF